MGSTETSGGPAAELARVSAALRRSEHRFRDVIERKYPQLAEAVRE